MTEWAQRGIFRLASYLALYFAVTGWLENERQLRTICKVLLWSTVATALFGFYQLAAGDYTLLYWFFYATDENALPWSGRITSFLNYSNSLAGYLNLVIPLGIGMAASRLSPSLKRLGALTAILGSMAMVFTESRGGLLALAVTFLLALWCFGTSTRMRMTVTVLGVFVAPLVLLILSSYSERLSVIDPDAGRLLLWAAAWGMFLSSPILGVGYGNFRESFDPTQIGFTLGAVDAHTLYLQLLSETGVIGCILFCGLCAAIVVMIVKRLRHPQPDLQKAVLFAAMAAVVSLLVHGTVDYLFEVSPQFGGAFWLMMGLLSAVVAIQKTAKAESPDANRI
jgi:O-antigen ligase